MEMSTGWPILSRSLRKGGSVPSQATSCVKKRFAMLEICQPRNRPAAMHKFPSKEAASFRMQVRAVLTARPEKREESLKSVHNNHRPPNHGAVHRVAHPFANCAKGWVRSKAKQIPGLPKPGAALTICKLRNNRAAPHQSPSKETASFRMRVRAVLTARPEKREESLKSVHNTNKPRHQEGAPFRTALSPPRP